MRQIAILIAVLLFALVFNSILPKSSNGQLDRATVEKFIIEDAKVNYGEQASYKIVKFEKKDSKWSIELDATIDVPSKTAGEFCKKTYRRYYSLFPIVFREELWSSTC